MHYEAKDGRLRIKDGHAIVWEGTFDEVAVVRVVALPGTADCLVLVDDGDERLQRNLLRIDTNGGIVWRAEAPPQGLFYVEVRADGDRVVAWSWSAYAVRLDPHTGKIVEAHFTK